MLWLELHSFFRVTGNNVRLRHGSVENTVASCWFSQLRDWAWFTVERTLSDVERTLFGVVPPWIHRGPPPPGIWKVNLVVQVQERPLTYITIFHGPFLQYMCLRGRWDCGSVLGPGWVNIMDKKVQAVLAAASQRSARANAMTVLPKLARGNSSISNGSGWGCVAGDKIPFSITFNGILLLKRNFSTSIV